MIRNFVYSNSYNANSLWEVNQHYWKTQTPLIKRLQITSESFIVFLISVLSSFFFQVFRTGFCSRKSPKLQHLQSPNFTHMWTLASCHAPDIFQADLDDYSGSRAKIWIFRIFFISLKLITQFSSLTPLQVDLTRETFHLL